MIMRLVKHFYVRTLATDAELMRIDNYLKLHTNFHKRKLLLFNFIDYNIPIYRD
jgi:hypothetical protein